MSIAPALPRAELGRRMLPRSPGLEDGAFPSPGTLGRAARPGVTPPYCNRGAMSLWDRDTRWCPPVPMSPLYTRCQPRSLNQAR